MGDLAATLQKDGKGRSGFLGTDMCVHELKRLSSLVCLCQGTLLGEWEAQPAVRLLVTFFSGILGKRVEERDIWF